MGLASPAPWQHRPLGQAVWMFQKSRRWRGPGGIPFFRETKTQRVHLALASARLILVQCGMLALTTPCHVNRGVRGRLHGEAESWVHKPLALRGRDF